MKRNMRFLKVLTISAMLVIMTFGNAFAVQTQPADTNIVLGGEPVSLSSLAEFEFDDSESIPLFGDVGITENVSLSASAGFSTFSASSTLDQAPVAGLDYMLYGNNANLIDGNISTYTQIAWIWAGETYHPDGTAITDYYLWGTPTAAFNSSIIGYLTSNGQYVGFVTQFPSAGTYTLNFQVGDANGVESNIFSMTIGVREMGFSDLNVAYASPPNLGMFPNACFFNGSTLLSAAASTNDAQTAYDNAKLSLWPGSHNRVIQNLNVTGYVKYGNGSPVANKTVHAVLTGNPTQYPYETNVTTNANGFFTVGASSYALNNYMGGQYAVSFGFGDLGTYAGSIVYSNFKSTAGYYYPGTLSVYTVGGDAFFEENAYVNVGGTTQGMLLANKWFYYLGEWYDF